MFQVVLGSDVVHDTWMAAAVLRTLRRSLATSGRAVLVMPAAYHRPWVTAGMGGFSVGFWWKNIKKNIQTLIETPFLKLGVSRSFWLDFWGHEWFFRDVWWFFWWIWGYCFVIVRCWGGILLFSKGYFMSGRKDGSILRNIDYPAEHDCFLMGHLGEFTYRKICDHGFVRRNHFQMKWFQLCEFMIQAETGGFWEEAERVGRTSLG